MCGIGAAISVDRQRVPHLRAALAGMNALLAHRGPDGSGEWLHPEGHVGLTHRRGHFPRELSGGEQQRVAIARALVNRPRVLIADEPTGNLDPVTSWEIIKLLTRVQELGTTLVMATHNAEIVNALRRRVIHLDHGSVVRDEREGLYAA